MSFPRYPEYKDSGVEWLEKVPGHWDISALKRVAYLHSGESITAESIDTEGQYPVFGGNGLRGYTDSFTHEGHYALIGRQGALCGNINYAKGQFWASEHAVVATPVRSISTVWLGELMRAMDLNQYSVSAAQPGLSVEIVSNLRIPVPPLSEQNAIAAFLSHETAKIEGLMAEKEKLIALLKEKRQAVISHAVTKGLDPTAPMKDSGVEWLGEVPAHWEVSQLKYVARDGTSITYGIVQAGPHVEGGIPYIKTSDMSGESLPLEGYSRTSREIDQSYSRSKVFFGDLVIAIRASVGKCLPLPEELDGANLTQGTAKISPGECVERDYLLNLINSTGLQVYFDSMAKGATFKEITLDMLRRTPVLIPPLAEQRDIARYLATELKSFQNLLQETEKAISLLKERRTALISAAVTGQIDVRGPVKDEQEQAA
ncbi:restriction endonuclease subunit S [Pseudomonas sediminis]|uniref:Restriction endonuclease subunit S n=1 Tax=Pseudomonas sediminis TaxID=1691904 RepID=A0A2G5FH50_9PSED|nr:restriction endonuclease subunit S [Pseudomonas sediminis]PIA67319.1 restriction endonuclease subunit S [Pseudomonas sediminis]